MKRTKAKRTFFSRLLAATFALAAFPFLTFGASAAQIPETSLEDSSGTEEEDWRKNIPEPEEKEPGERLLPAAPSGSEIPCSAEVTEEESGEPDFALIAAGSAGAVLLVAIAAMALLVKETNARNGTDGAGKNGKKKPPKKSR